ncbi:MULTISPECIES: triacylglycerol lipase [unclassified Nocardia]|uniref:esterase/lipase family protein n=1 Tax=unclassified Nocardia TaxID=2637762 RepID=UPI001CE49E6C|nr:MULTISPECIES: alpha/beta fold hydrolase [unclassified Nocardia]
MIPRPSGYRDPETEGVRRELVDGMIIRIIQLSQLIRMKGSPMAGAKRRFAAAFSGLLCCSALFGSLAPNATAAPFGKNPDGSVAPPGANDWSCAPSAAHPEPVVLVHGTWDNQNAWDVLAPRLKAVGYCVFSLNYGRDATSVFGSIPGQYATGDIRASAREVGAFVERVRAATGAAKVALVGHSQGAVVSRQYVRFDGGGDRVGHLITLVGSNHGTSYQGLVDANRVDTPQSPEHMAAPLVGVAIVQQLVGSEFLHQLNDDGETVPGIDYTAIASRLDDVSRPPEETFLHAGPGATVHNVMVQDLCPADPYLHATLPNSPTVAYIVERALDPSFEGNPCP